jgi:DNA invertase Pin-like site-specific DNA recombinase
MKIVTYIRVSTKAQGESGLGLDAQTTAIDAYTTQHKAVVVGTFKEVETGKNNERPQLAKALHLAKVTGSRLIIAKLDRLSRNAAFLLNLRDAGVDFVCCDDPNATPLTAGIMAVIAQHEATVISERTKAALQAAKARGKQLGNPNGAAALRRADKGNVASRIAATAKANAFATDLVTTLADILTAGDMSLAAIAAELNERLITTARGGKWHAVTVANLYKRIAA